MSHRMLPLLTGAALSFLAAFAPPTVDAAEAQKTVVLVHGAFADGSSWSKVIPLLQENGLKVVAVQNPLSSLAADIAVTKRVIDAQDGPVVLVGHSWGGVVISAAGVNDKVKALVFVAAFALPPGVSVNEANAGQPPLPWLGELEQYEGGYLRLSDKGIAQYFAQDLSADEQALVAATQGPTLGALFDEKSDVSAIGHVPSWYVVAKSDKMIPAAAESAMATAINATVSEVESSHVVMLSHPRDVADAIIAAAETVN